MTVHLPRPLPAVAFRTWAARCRRQAASARTQKARGYWRGLAAHNERLAENATRSISIHEPRS